MARAGRVGRGLGNTLIYRLAMWETLTYICGDRVRTDWERKLETCANYNAALKMGCQT